MVVNYANGKIYRIVCNISGKQYIGSTTQSLSMRLAGHKKDYNYFLKGNKNWITSFEIIKNNDYSIILIENVNCNCKEELFKRERFYIESMSCVNRHVPTRTFAEYYEANKEHIQEWNKQYREANKQEISEQRKDYYEANKDKILELRKDYYEENKQEISERKKIYRGKNKQKISELKKEYYEANKEKIKDKRKKPYQCLCGSVVSICVKYRHFKSKKHIAYLESLKEEN